MRALEIFLETSAEKAINENFAFFNLKAFAVEL